MQNHPLQYNNFANLSDLEALIAFVQKQLLDSFKITDATADVLQHSFLNSNSCLSAKASQIHLFDFKNSLKSVLSFDDFTTCLQELSNSSQQLQDIYLTNLSPELAKKKLDSLLESTNKSETLNKLLQVDYNSNKQDDFKYSYLWTDVSWLLLPLNEKIADNNYNLNHLAPFFALKLVEKQDNDKFCYNLDNESQEQKVKDTVNNFLESNNLTYTQESLNYRILATLIASFNHAPKLTNFVANSFYYLLTSNSQASVDELQTQLTAFQKDFTTNSNSNTHSTAKTTVRNNQQEQQELLQTVTHWSTIDQFSISRLLSKLHLFLAISNKHATLDYQHEDNLYFLTLALCQLKFTLELSDLSLNVDNNNVTSQNVSSQVANREDVNSFNQDNQEQQHDYQLSDLEMALSSDCNLYAFIGDYFKKLRIADFITNLVITNKDSSLQSTTVPNNLNDIAVATTNNYICQQSLLNPFVKQHHKAQGNYWSLVPKIDFVTQQYQEYKELCNTSGSKNLTSPNYLRLLPRHDNVTLSNNKLATLLEIWFDLQFISKHKKQLAELNKQLELLLDVTTKHTIKTKHLVETNHLNTTKHEELTTQPSSIAQNIATLTFQLYTNQEFKSLRHKPCCLFADYMVDDELWEKRLQEKNHLLNSSLASSQEVDKEFHELLSPTNVINFINDQTSLTTQVLYLLSHKQLSSSRYNDSIFTQNPSIVDQLCYHQSIKDEDVSLPDNWLTISQGCNLLSGIHDQAVGQVYFTTPLTAPHDLSEQRNYYVTMRSLLDITKLDSDHTPERFTKLTAQLAQLSSLSVEYQQKLNNKATANQDQQDKQNSQNISSAEQANISTASLATDISSRLQALRDDSPLYLSKLANLVYNSEQLQQNLQATIETSSNYYLANPLLASEKALYNELITKNSHSEVYKNNSTNTREANNNETNNNRYNEFTTEQNASENSSCLVANATNIYGFLKLTNHHDGALDRVWSFNDAVPVVDKVASIYKDLKVNPLFINLLKFLPHANYLTPQHLIEDNKLYLLDPHHPLYHSVVKSKLVFRGTTDVYINDVNVNNLTNSTVYEPRLVYQGYQITNSDNALTNFAQKSREFIQHQYSKYIEDNTNYASLELLSNSNLTAEKSTAHRSNLQHFRHFSANFEKFENFTTNSLTTDIPREEGLYYAQITRDKVKSLAFYQVNYVNNFLVANAGINEEEFTSKLINQLQHKKSCEQANLEQLTVRVSSNSDSGANKTANVSKNSNDYNENQNSESTLLTASGLHDNLLTSLQLLNCSNCLSKIVPNSPSKLYSNGAVFTFNANTYNHDILMPLAQVSLNLYPYSTNQTHYITILDNDTSTPYRSLRDIRHHLQLTALHSNRQQLLQQLGENVLNTNVTNTVYNTIDCDEISQEEFAERLQKTMKIHNNRNSYYSFKQVSKHFKLRDFLRKIVNDSTINNHSYITILDTATVIDDILPYLTSLEQRNASGMIIMDRLQNPEFLRLLFQYPNTKFNQYIILDHNHLLNLNKLYLKGNYHYYQINQINLNSCNGASLRLMSGCYLQPTIKAQHYPKLNKNSAEKAELINSLFTPHYLSISNGLSLTYENVNDLLSVDNEQILEQVSNANFLETLEANSLEQVKQQLQGEQQALANNLAQLQKVITNNHNLEVSELTDTIDPQIKYLLANLPLNHLANLHSDISKPYDHKISDWSLATWELIASLEQRSYHALSTRLHLLSNSVSNPLNSDETCSQKTQDKTLVVNLINQVIKLAHNSRDNLLEYLNLLLRQQPVDNLSFDVLQQRQVYLITTKLLNLITNLSYDYTDFILLYQILSSYLAKLTDNEKAKLTGNERIDLTEAYLYEITHNCRIAFLLSKAKQTTLQQSSKHQNSAQQNTTQQKYYYGINLSNIKGINLVDTIKIYNGNNNSNANRISEVNTSILSSQASSETHSLSPANLQSKTNKESKTSCHIWLDLKLVTGNNPYATLNLRNHLNHNLPELHKEVWQYFVCEIQGTLDHRQQDLNIKYNGQYLPLVMSVIPQSSQQQYLDKLQRPGELANLPYYWCDLLSYSPFMNWRYHLAVNSKELTLADNLFYTAWYCSNVSEKTVFTNSEFCNRNDHPVVNIYDAQTRLPWHLIASLHSNLPLRPTDARNGARISSQHIEFLLLAEARRGRKESVTFNDTHINAPANEVYHLLANPRFKPAVLPNIHNFSIRKDLLALTQSYWDHDDFCSFDILRAVAQFSPQSLLTSTNEQFSLELINSELVNNKKVNHADINNAQFTNAEINTAKINDSATTTQVQQLNSIQTNQHQSVTSTPQALLSKQSRQSFFTTIIARSEWFETLNYPFGSYYQHQKTPSTSIKVLQPKLQLRILNLDKDTGKLKQLLTELNPILQELAQAGLQVDVIRQRGVYGRNLSEDEINWRFDRQKFMHNYNRKATSGEIGCSLSYIELLQQVAGDNSITDTDYIMIMEDDPVFFPQYSQKLLSILGQLHTARLQGDKVPRWVNLTHYAINQGDLLSGAELETLKHLTFNSKSDVYKIGTTSWHKPATFATIGTVNVLIRKDLIREMVNLLGHDMTSPYPYTTMVKCSWLADDYIKYPGMGCADFALANPVLTSFSETANEGSAIADERRFNIAYRQYLPRQRLYLE